MGKLTPEEQLAAMARTISAVSAGDQLLDLIQKVPEIWREKPCHFHLWLLRKLAKMTQAELASKAGVQQSFVAKVERGRDVRISTMRRLYAALGHRMFILPLKMPSHALSPSQER